MSRLPASTATEVQRILDGAARRLLAARLDGDPVGPTTGDDYCLLDDGADQGALLVESEQAPVARGNGHRRRRGRL